MLTKEFVLAGRAVFTVENPQGEYATFRVGHKAASGKWGEAWFVSLLTGQDNENDYTYLGLLDKDTGGVRLTAKSQFKDDSRPTKIVRWALQQVWRQAELPTGYQIRHNGKCCRCGRTLTTPESLTDGFGPECKKKLSAA